MTNYRSLVPGGFFSSDPYDRSIPVAIRTNNPGAINAVPWVRQQPGFVIAKLTTPKNATAIFEAPEYGVATWWELLHRYGDVFADQPLTLGRIISTYCGRGRETEAVEYLQFVAAKVGVTGDHAVSLSDGPGLELVARAFFHYEAGRPSPLASAQIQHGFKLAAMRAGYGPDPTPVRLLDRLGTEAAGGERRSTLVEIARAEAERHLKWTGPASEAEKYLAPLREPMRRLGHIGEAPVFYNWCAAFVTWCARSAGYDIPDQPVGFPATVALVESWKYWGGQQGYLMTGTPLAPQAGDILLYEWFDGDATLDHIGIAVAPAEQGSVLSAEGNAKNKTDLVTRSLDTVAGLIRLPG